MLTKFVLKHCLFLVPIFVIFLAISIDHTIAETWYVSDTLIISIREGQTDEDRVIGYLRSDTPVETIEETESLMKIRTEHGLEGWVKKKYLVSEKPKAMVIIELKKQIQQLQEKIKLLQSSPGLTVAPETVQKYEARIATLESLVKQEKENTIALRNELRQSKAKYNQLLKSRHQNSNLEKENLALKDENKQLMDEIKSLQKNSSSTFLSGKMNWFLVGGAVLLLGFIIGRSVRRTKPYHRY